MPEPGAFTLNACNRCRKRKARCDTAFPKCGPCHASNSTCETTDVKSKATFTRYAIQELEQEILSLEEQIRQRISIVEGREDPSAAPPPFSEPSDTVHSASEVETHYFGESSGMGLARSVIESTQRTYSSIRPIHSTFSASSPAQQGPDTTDSPVIPSFDIAMDLVDIFFDRYLIQYPILLPSEFKPQVRAFYNGEHPNSVMLGFMLNLVFSISLTQMVPIRPDALRQAKSYGTAALANLDEILRPKSLQSLQCLLLLLLSSILRPTSAPIWYISGLCVRMAIDLGYHSESTIRLEGTGIATTERAELKRRLFWVTYTFDRDISSMLGRPFSLDDDKIDAEPPETNLPELQKASILHWLRLQRLQSEIVHRMHPRQETSADEFDRWRLDISLKLDEWMAEANDLAMDSGVYDRDWWSYWYHNTVLTLHRTTLLHRKRGNDVSSSIMRAYVAAKELVLLGFIRLTKEPLNWTCLEVHSHLMGGITLLFLVINITEAMQSALADWTAFRNCLAQWQSITDRLSERWDNLVRTNEVMRRLVIAVSAVLEKPQRHGTRKRQRDETDGQSGRTQRVIRPIDSRDETERRLRPSWPHGPASCFDPIISAPPMMPDADPFLDQQMSNQAASSGCSADPQLSGLDAVADMALNDLDLSAILTSDYLAESNPRDFADVTQGLWECLQLPSVSIGATLPPSTLVGNSHGSETSADLVLSFQDSRSTTDMEDLIALWTSG